MNLMYFERKRGVPDDYRSPIIVPSGHYSGVLFAGEVLISDPREASDLNDMGCFGCFIERREPIVTPECFRIERRALRSADKANKLETKKRALRLAVIEKANEIHEKATSTTISSIDLSSREADKVSSNETPSASGVNSEPSRNLDASTDSSSEAFARKSGRIDSGGDKEKPASHASEQNMDARSEINENEETYENTKQMELWANMVSKDRRLRLGMEEAMYLMYDLSVLEVSAADKQLSADDLWRCFYSYAGISFVKRYACYRSLRRLGWVVRPGLPYGVDFMLYCDGPEYHHSSAAVRLLDEHIDATLFSALNRTLNNMKKTLVEVRVDIPVGLPLGQGVKCVQRINVEYLTVATCRLQNVGSG
uniref:tRNA-intron lyase n=1 Tax=Ascaris suum TaxID=6253 RepID=F1LA84_ASCSU